VGVDDQFDQTQDGRRLKLLNIVDEHTREALTIEVNRRIDADATVEAFTTRLKARVLVEDWRIEDNTVRPTAPWLPDPDRLRPHLDHPTCTPITGGHQTGSRQPGWYRRAAARW
jgi:hypothetical protein